MLRFTRTGLAFAMASLFLLSCGGGGGGGGGSSPAPSTPGNNTNNSNSGVGAVPTGTPVVYLAAAADATTFVPGVNTTIPGDTQQLFQYVPATNTAKVVDTNSSFSFASSTLSSLTQEGRLYHVNRSNSVNRWDVYPVDLATGVRGSPIRFSLDPFPTSCMAVVGSDLIYRDSGGSNTWKKVINFGSTTSPTALVIGSAATTDRCTFNLASVNGRLFDAEFVDAAGSGADSFIIRERSPATGGVIATLGTLTEAGNPQNYANYLFAFDRSFFYLVRREISSGNIEIFRFDYSAITNPVLLRGTITPSTPITGPVRLDVHNGFLAMIAYTGTSAPLGAVRLFTFDDATQQSQETLLGNGFYDLQVLNLP